MALPAHVLEKLSPMLLQSASQSARLADSQLGLSLGHEALDAALPDQGLPRGAVVEFAVRGAAVATSLSLAACRSAQREAVEKGGKVPWCAFIDPSGTLYAPGVMRAGVEAERLLVVRPPLEALSRVALRVVESHAFSVVVIDTLGTVGSRLDVSLGAWPRVIRRLSLALEGTAQCVILLTDAEERRPLPLPVAERIEFTRSLEDKLIVRVAKERRGRVSHARPIRWTRPDENSGGAAAHRAPALRSLAG